MKIIYYLSFTLLIMSSSCKSTQKKNTTLNKTISFTEIIKGNHSNVKKEQLLFIENNDELNRIYGIINSTRRPGFKIPTIDFTNEIVLGLFMGSKTTGGYSIQIERIENNDKEMVVYYTETQPLSRATSVMTQPFFIAKIAKTNAEIRFEKVVEK